MMDLQDMQVGEDAQEAPPPKLLDPRLCDRTQDDIALMRRQQAAWRAYYGEFRDSVATDPGGAQPSRNRNVKSNRIAAIVDKTAAWLSKGVAIEVADKGADDEKPKPSKPKPGTKGKPATQDKRQVALESILGSQEKLKAFLTQVFMTGSVTGHAYVRIHYDSTRDPKPAFRLLDSQHVWVVTDPDDCNTALVYVIEYERTVAFVDARGQAQKTVKRQLIYRCHADGSPVYDPDAPDCMTADDDVWMIATYTRNGAAAMLQSGSVTWKMVGQPIKWPYSDAPIVDCMNLPAPTQYYGLPDVPPEQIALNERLNDIQSDVATVLEAFALPIPYATGMGNGEVVKPPPGAVLLLPEGATANVLQPRGDVASARDFANDLRADMDERSRVPAVALGRQESMPRGNLSGIALELLFQPLIEKIELQQVLYGPMIQDLCLRLLVVGGYASADTTEVRLRWAKLLSKDTASAAQLALAMSQVGTSEHAIDGVLDLDYDEEQEYKAEEAQAELAAVMKGQSLPPPPPLVDPNAAPPPPQQPGQPAQPVAAAPNGQMPPVNHPAAQLARARMTAATKGK